jgi:hypothetical protein
VSKNNEEVCYPLLVCLLNIQTIPFAPPARSLVSVESRPFAPNAVLVDADVAVAVGGSDRTGPALVISVTHTRYGTLTAVHCGSIAIFVSLALATSN